MIAEVPERSFHLGLDRPRAPKKVENSWAGLIDWAGGGAQGGGGYSGYNIFGPSGGNQTIAQGNTFNLGVANAPYTLQLIGLNYGYMSYGVVQTLIDEPVDDAFKGGLVINIPEMKAEEVKLLHKAMRKNRDLHAIKQGFKWGRLFGGSGLIIATDQPTNEPLDVEAIQPGTPLSFLPCDRWELTAPRVGTAGYPIAAPYVYYGQTIDWSRVIRIKGREAPARIRSLLQGWGMSELERCMRDINSFYKLQTVIFELIDEAKIDVYRLEQLNTLLGTPGGTQTAILRVMFANLLKNYKTAIVMDKEDEYEQKTMAFSGLADMFEQARINLAGATRMPVNKLFGLAATGFASGEDAMENYNALVESDIREPAMPLLDDVIGLRCMQVYGYIPDFTVEFKPLRIVDPVQEEGIKTSKQNRAAQLRQMDQISGKEMDDVLHKEGLLDIETEVGKGLREPAPAGDDPGEDDDGKPDPKGAPKKNAQDEHARKYSWLQKQASRGRFKSAFRKAA